jgi:hypothetical protein
VCAGLSGKKEDPPPGAGKKRIEIRLSAGRGSLSLDSPTLGHFEHAGEEEACYYLDLDVNQLYDFHLASRESGEGSGVIPSLRIREYGPAGGYWYDILEVTCGIGSTGCTPDVARAWQQSWVERRKRGRLDACGSLVVAGLKWNTSGGQAEANGWLLRDFNVDFGLEVKKFATQFPPGAPQCQAAP